MRSIIFQFFLTPLRPMARVTAVFDVMNTSYTTVCYMSNKNLTGGTNVALDLIFRSCRHSPPPVGVFDFCSMDGKFRLRHAILRNGFKAFDFSSFFVVFFLIHAATCFR